MKQLRVIRDQYISKNAVRSIYSIFLDLDLHFRTQESLWKSPTPSVSSDAEPQLLPIQQPTQHHLMQPQAGHHHRHNFDSQKCLQKTLSANEVCHTYVIYLLCPKSNRTSAMELFSRRRRRLVSDQLSNKFGYCPLCTASIVL